MAKRSELHYLAQGSDNPEVLYSCEHGVPVLWVMCFGTRNNWVPGESVEVRGARATRNKFETTVEDAQYRLEQVEDTLRTVPYLWPWLSSLVIFRRRVNTRPKNGLLRLAAPWVAQQPHLAEEFRAVVSLAENAVNLAGVGHLEAARSGLEKLMPFCPVIFFGDESDTKRFTLAPQTGADTVRAHRLARLTLGEPTRDRDVFDRLANEIVEPALVELEKLPPPPKPAAPKAAAPVPTSPGAKPSPGAPAEPPADKPGLFGRISGLFRKKG